MNNFFSQREREVIDLVAAGLSNKAVGEKLGITEKTVKFHLTNIFRTAQVKRRTELIVMHFEGDLDVHYETPNIRPPEVSE